MSYATPDEIYQLAIKHGFKPGEEAAHATAIALAESQGNLAAFNPKDPHGGSVGLMQINGANAGLIGGSDWKNIGQDPDASMAAAYALYSKRGNFTDWGSYNDGRYKQFYNQAAKIASVPGITLTSLPSHPHTLTPPTAGAPYTPEAVASANPPAAAAPPQDAGNWLQKFITKPPPTKDAQGNDVEQKSPLEKIAGSFGTPSNQQAAPAPEAPPMQPVADPNPGLAPAAQQLFQTVSANAARPLTWGSRPYGYGAGQQFLGTTLNQTGYGQG